MHPYFSTHVQPWETFNPIDIGMCRCSRCCKGRPRKSWDSRKAKSHVGLWRSCPPELPSLASLQHCC